MPDRRGHEPQYGSQSYRLEDRWNRLLQILGGNKGSEPTQWPNYHAKGELNRLHQDANVLVSEMEPGFQHSIELGADRQAYLVCIEGSLDVNGGAMSLAERDAMAVQAAQPAPLVLKAGDKGAHFLMVEMALE